MKPLALTFVALAGLATAVSAQSSEFGEPPEFWAFEFPKADFSKTSVHFSEITTVIRRDQIPAIHDVSYITIAEDDYIGPREPVMTVEIDGAEPRAFPIRYLMFHEIVNAEVGGVPIAVTYCPLCNSGMVFDRRVDGETISFGVSGKLRNSDMVMYDLETNSLWQQALGVGIVGQYTGAELTQLPAWMESWAEFKDRNPDGLVMAMPRAGGGYGRNPYVGYDTRDRPYAQFYNGENPPFDVPALMRVVRVGDRAWTLARLQEDAPVTEAGVTITWAAGQASAMDSGIIAEGRDVGTIRVKDAETGADVPHDVLFAFAFHSFWPDGEWMLGEDG